MGVALLKTPLDALHRRLGARMVEFAGYGMPLQYAGIMAEHNACREGAALFDVSHMGQVEISAPAAFEKLVPGDILSLTPGRQRYTLLLDAAGGIIDDLMVANFGGRFVAVLNAGRKDVDVAHMRANGVHIRPFFESATESAIERFIGSAVEHVAEDLAGGAVEHGAARALLALQGPKAAEILPEGAAQKFMDAAELEVAGIACTVTRSGYTGEDGFEIGCDASHAEALAKTLLARGAVPAGLGARDSLRLEAGLPLYGNDISDQTNPVEAGLIFALSKKRCAAADFLGAEAVNAALANGTDRKLVGIRLDGRAPARAGADIQHQGESVGYVTSGGFSPTLGAAIALGYVRAALAVPGTALALIVRGKPLPGAVTALPFVPHRYHR